MSTYTTTTWPVIDKEAVCAVQTLSGAGTLTLNGTLASSSTPNQISFIANNMIRSVSLTAGASSLSGITFTVSGFQNGAFVTEPITGPAANATVYGLYYYDYITSVVSGAAATDISVGTGKAGYLPIVTVNTNNTLGNVNYSCTVLLSSGSSITYSLLQTLDAVTTNFISFKAQIGSFFPIPNMSALISATTSQMGNSTAITNYLLLEISSTAPTTDTLNFIFLQE